MKYLITILSIIILFSNIDCSRGCIEAQYNFSMQEVFYPEHDTILVGDTIFMESSHSTTFNDTLINKSIDFSGSDIGGSLRLLRFPDTSTIPVGGINNFEILIFYGKSSGNDNIPSENKGFYFVEDNNQYILKLGFIAKQKGIYSISLGNSIGIIKRKSSCEKANITIINTNNNNHLYFYQNWRPGYLIPEYERTHIYCFIVK